MHQVNSYLEPYEVPARTYTSSGGETGRALKKRRSGSGPEPNVEAAAAPAAPAAPAVPMAVTPSPSDAAASALFLSKRPARNKLAKDRATASRDTRAKQKQAHLQLNDARTRLSRVCTSLN